MIEFPETKESVGPAQIQQILQAIEWLKDKVRSQQVLESQTVHRNVTSIGTTLESVPPSPGASDSLPVWLP